MNASLKIESWPLDKLVHYARNPRKNDAQVDRMVSAIREFGFRIPVVAKSDGTVVDGHLRLKAAAKLGMAEVPVVLADELTDAQVKAFRILANKSANWAEWDTELLTLEIEELQAMAYDVTLTGFDTVELDALLAPAGTDGLTDPDDVPETPEEPMTKPGDLYVLGNHRLLCGDSTSAEDVARLMNGESVDCVFTSPPYAVGLDYGKTYEDTLDNLRSMLPILSKMWLGVVVRGGFAVVNFGDIVSGRAAAGSDEPCEYPMAIEYWPPFRANGWFLWSRRVWCKPNARVHSPWAIKSNRAASDWENVWTWKAPGKAIVQRVNGKYQSANGWFDTSKEHGVDVGKKTHGAGMAVSLPVRMIEIHSRPGMVVYEPFCGTGTTIIAVEMTGRRVFAGEISPSYCDVIVKRWEEFTGKKAVLEGGQDGRS